MEVLARSIRNYCRFFEIVPHELSRILRKDSTLVRAGLVVKARYGHEIEISDHIGSFLSGLTDGTLSDKFFESRKDPVVHELADFPISPANIAVMKGMMECSAQNKC